MLRARRRLGVVTVEVGICVSSARILAPHERWSNPPNERRVTARRSIAAKAVKPARIAERAIVSAIDAAHTGLIKRLTSECEQIGQVLAIRPRCERVARFGQACLHRIEHFGADFKVARTNRGAKVRKQLRDRNLRGAGASIAPSPGSRQPQGRAIRRARHRQRDPTHR